ncbi:DUF5615 family PIN-like protein [Desulfococcaceae bacterium HSG9]|nr:DUF5615 family PIN-like protein [Desulfococcaceae bacterium HSG9]
MKHKGYDTKTVRNLDPQMDDEEIIRIAFAENRMIVTMDKDFGELVYHFSMKHSGILLLRLEDATGSEKLKVIKNIMTNYADKIKDCFCVFQHNKFRIKKIKEEREN